MKKKTPKKKTKHSGSNLPSNLPEVDIVINRVISASSKLLKICMNDPRKDQVRISYNNLHTLKWVLDVTEQFKDNPERFRAMLKFIDDVDYFADKLLGENTKATQHYLEMISENYND